MKKNDRILIGILLLVAIGFLAAGFLLKQNPINGEAVVLINGAEYGRYPLSQDCKVELPGKLGSNTLTIQDGQAYMSDAVCPDKICMEFGKIHYNTEMIVCRPGGIVVMIENGETSEMDAVQ